MLSNKCNGLYNAIKQAILFYSFQSTFSYSLIVLDLFAIGLVPAFTTSIFHPLWAAMHITDYIVVFKCYHLLLVATQDASREIAGRNTSGFNGVRSSTLSAAGNSLVHKHWLVSVVVN